MALKDFLFKGSYSTITNIQYEKCHKRIQFTISVFAEKTDSPYPNVVNTVEYLLGVTEEIPGFGEEEFEKFFGIKALESQGNNLHAAIYNYLKTTEAFTGVKDA